MARTFSVARHLIRQFFLFLNPASGTSAIQRDSSDNGSVEFSPIFDTARALFWNHSDERICSVCYNKDKNRKGQYLEKYVRRSHPKTGWNNTKRINHFELIERIVQDYPKYKPILIEIGHRAKIEKVKRILQKEFRNLMIPERRRLILDCLELRLSFYMKCVGKEKLC